MGPPESRKTFWGSFGLGPARGRLWGLAALLIALNVALMALDVLVLPARGVREMVPLSPPPQRELLPQPRANQFDLLLGRLGFRTVELGRPQPAVRPLSKEPRPRPTASPPPALRPLSLHQPGGGGLALHLVALLTLASSSVALAYFLPGRFRVMREALGGPWPHILRTLAIGVLGYLAALLLAFLLAIGVSGLLYAVLVLAVLAVLTAVGLTAVALALGRWLSSLAGAQAPPLAQLLLGVLGIFPLTILPYAGWAAAALLASFGLGAILLTRMGSGKRWSLEALQ